MARAGLDGTDQACGEGEDGADELEDASDDDAEHAEGEKDQPDKGVEDQGEQGCGPAEDEEDQKEEKLHWVVAAIPLRCTQGRRCWFCGQEALDLRVRAS
jgi:hypothetical protein